MDGRDILANILANILDGRTALGRHIPPPGNDPIAFPGDDATRMAVHTALDIASRMFGDIGAKDEPFTAFARKMVFFVRKSGVMHESPSFLTRVGHATDAACRHPKILSTTVGFAALVNIGLTIKAEAANHRTTDPDGSRILTLDEEIDCMRRKAKPPEPPVRWRSEDGTYTLLELTHPFHIWEEGMRLNNCLSRVSPHLSGSRVKGTESPDRLQDLDYWDQVEDGALRIFSLRQDRFIAVAFSLKGRRMYEITVHLRNIPEVWHAFTDAAAALDNEIGPLIYEFISVPTAANDLLWHVACERDRRHGRPLPPEASLSNGLWRRRV